MYKAILDMRIEHTNPQRPFNTQISICVTHYASQKALSSGFQQNTAPGAAAPSLPTLLPP